MCGGGDDEVKETAEERDLATVSMERYLDYQDRFVDIEKAFAKSAKVTGAERAAVRGGVNADVALNNSVATRQSMGELRASGARPGSGRFMATLGNLSKGLGGRQSSALVATDNNLTDLDVRGRQKIINLGRGTADNAQLGLSQVALMSGQNEQANTLSNAASRRANASAVGTVLGAGASALSQPQPVNGYVEGDAYMPAYPRYTNN